MVGWRDGGLAKSKVCDLTSQFSNLKLSTLTNAAMVCSVTYLIFPQLLNSSLEEEEPLSFATSEIYPCESGYFEDGASVLEVGSILSRIGV